MLKFMATLAMAAMCCSGLASAQTAPFTVDGNIALQSFVSLTDGHIRTTLDTLTTFATTAAARSGDWKRVEGPLQAATSTDVAGTNFYGLPSGRYYVVGKGLQPVPINDRAYFATVFSGKADVGQLLLGRSTGKPGAIVAVPVRAADGKVVALIGSSIDLAQLTVLLKTEMGIGSGVVFWAVDEKGVTALHSDPTNIFDQAGKRSPELAKALEHMMSTDSGAAHYSYKGQARTVLFRHSTLTRWTYGFGVLH